MTTISLRFDDEMKKELDEMCEDMGMNLTTFFMIYAKKALRERKIPFEIAAPEQKITREGIMQSFLALRTSAKEQGLQDMSLDAINDEIRRTRYGEAAE